MLATIQSIDLFYFGCHWTKEHVPELYWARAAYFVQAKVRFPVYSDVSDVSLIAEKRKKKKTIHWAVHAQG